MPMTYNDLALMIMQNFSAEQRNMTVTVLEDGEFYPADIEVISDSDVLDPFHPVIEAMHSSTEKNKT